METSVQPAGAVAVGFWRTSTTATITSPLTTPAGGLMIRLVVVLLAAVADRAEGDRGRRGAAVTVQVKVSVAPTVAKLSSLTVMEVAYGLLAVAPAAIVPEIWPVVALIDRPVGSPVAA